MHLGVSSSIFHKPLYTFLVMTVLILSIFVVMGARSLFRRRRRRRRRRTVPSGPWVLLAPRETDAADLGKAPRLWDVHLAPPRAHTGMAGWDDIMPFAASCILPASTGITGLSLPSASTSAPPAAVARTLVLRNSTQAVNGPRLHQSRAHVAVLITMPMPVPVMQVPSVATAALTAASLTNTTAAPILSSKSSSGGYPLMGTPPTWIPDQPHAAPLSSASDGTGAGAGYVFAADCVPEPLRRLMPPLEVGLVDVGVVSVPMAAPVEGSLI